MKNRRQAIKTRETFLNRETGELTESVKVVSYGVKQDDNFIKLYTDEVPLLKTLTDLKLVLLLHMASHMDYSNEVTLTKRLIEDFLKMKSVTYSSLTKALTSLVLEGLLLRLQKGRYMINPYIIAKGLPERILELRESYKWKKTKE